MKIEKHILPIIVIAQFMCTSLWFAGNAVMPQLVAVMGLMPYDVGFMTSSVQLGFIFGTLIYALFLIADKFDSPTVFLASAILGALFNGLITLELSFFQVLTCRFLTGFFLAGIYPVGMKIAADYFEKGLGSALSYLVGALVLGTALPHLIASVDASLDWEVVLLATSALALLGGLLIKVFVGQGPYQKKSQAIKFVSMGAAFRNPNFRSAAFGYFGHMWELYAFWAFVPLILEAHSDSSQTISSDSFLVIGIGAIACFVGGALSRRYGVERMASTFLTLSGICCVFSPFAFLLSYDQFLIFLCFWGMVVIADSPLFSTLVAQRATPELKGTALTLVTCIGFAVTIFSIQLLSTLILSIDIRFLLIPLALGPIFGLLSLKIKTTSSSS